MVLGEQHVVRSVHLVRHAAKGVVTPRRRLTLAVRQLQQIARAAERVAVGQQRLIEAWAELHQDALLEDWRRLQAGQLPQPIAPLQ